MKPLILQEANKTLKDISAGRSVRFCICVHKIFQFFRYARYMFLET